MSTAPDTEARFVAKSTGTGGTRKRYLNPVPSAGAPSSRPKLEFAKRLQHALTEKGWSQADLARAVAKHMPSGEFGRDSISHYVRGLQMPGPVRLKAICKALGITREALIPEGSYATAEDGAPPFAIKSTTGEMVWLQVNQAVPMDTAIQIREILKTALEEK